MTATASLRQLFDSFAREHRSSQELLASLAFALRSFTNLHRFLELVPVVASRLVGVDGALLVRQVDSIRLSEGVGSTYNAVSTIEEDRCSWLQSDHLMPIRH